MVSVIVWPEVVPDAFSALLVDPPNVTVPVPPSVCVPLKVATAKTVPSALPNRIAAFIVKPFRTVT
jgi:hypothetical protein